MASNRETKLEKLKRVAKDAGPTGAWAKTQLMGLDPEYMRATYPAHFPPPPAPKLPAVPSTCRPNYEAAGDIEALAHALTTALADKWVELEELPFKGLEERVTLMLRDFEASDIPL